MNQYLARTISAREIRGIWEDLRVVSDRLAEVRLVELADKCFELELELLQLHGKLVQLPHQATSSTRPEYLPSPPENLPF